MTDSAGYKMMTDPRFVTFTFEFNMNPDRELRTWEDFEIRIETHRDGFDYALGRIAYLRSQVPALRRRLTLGLADNGNFAVSMYLRGHLPEDIAILQRVMRDELTEIVRLRRMQPSPPSPESPPARRPPAVLPTISPPPSPPHQQPQALPLPVDAQQIPAEETDDEDDDLPTVEEALQRHFNGQ